MLLLVFFSYFMKEIVSVSYKPSHCIKIFSLFICDYSHLSFSKIWQEVRDFYKNHILIKKPYNFIHEIVNEIVWLSSWKSNPLSLLLKVHRLNLTQFVSGCPHTNHCSYQSLSLLHLYPGCLQNVLVPTPMTSLRTWHCVSVNRRLWSDLERDFGETSERLQYQQGFDPEYEGTSEWLSPLAHKGLGPTPATPRSRRRRTRPLSSQHLFEINHKLY